MTSVATIRTSFVLLTKRHQFSGQGESGAWVNPERIAYIEPLRTPRGRVNEYGNYPEYATIGTRIYFAEDGILEVTEHPEQVMALLTDRS